MMRTDGQLPLILIVDDNPINLRVVGSELRSSGKYRIIFASNGGDALEQVYSEQPDLILLDIMMPEMSGYEVCSQLKQDPAMEKIPIIFLTAMNQVEDVVKGFELGGADYITKPFTPTILLSRVSTHLDLYLARQRDHELQERLSQAFSKDFSTKPGRIGFGLHSAANFILSIKGKIELHSDGVNQGATVTIQLPVHHLNT